MDLLKPIKNVQIIDRELVKPNNYNPNTVEGQEMDLLVQSILANGWTMPIVLRPDYTIIDGFHRWTLSGREPLLSKLKGKVPVVFVEHEDKSKNIYGTITHNRARGSHLLKPMQDIIETLLSEGKTVAEISKELGMGKEEIFRLTCKSREDFLKIMIKSPEYSKAKIIKNVRA